MYVNVCLIVGCLVCVRAYIYCDSDGMLRVKLGIKMRL